MAPGSRWMSWFKSSAKVFHLCRSYCCSSKKISWRVRIRPTRISSPVPSSWFVWRNAPMFCSPIFRTRTITPRKPIAWKGTCSSSVSGKITPLFTKRTAGSPSFASRSNVLSAANVCPFMLRIPAFRETCKAPSYSPG